MLFAKSRCAPFAHCSSVSRGAPAASHGQPGSEPGGEDLEGDRFLEGNAGLAVAAPSHFPLSLLKPFHRNHRLRPNRPRKGIVDLYSTLRNVPDAGAAT